MKRWAVMMFAVFAGLAHAAPGSMVKEEDLLSAPKTGASRLARLEKNAAVEVLARQGGWTQVRAGTRTGWVRILSVRTLVTSSAAGNLAALTQRRDDSRVVAVAGLRGLNEEELRAARFDANELTLLERHRVDAADATGFARAASLVARQIPYLPEPKPAGTQQTQPGTGFFGE